LLVVHQQPLQLGMTNMLQAVLLQLLVLQHQQVVLTSLMMNWMRKGQQGRLQRQQQLLQRQLRPLKQRQQRRLQLQLLLHGGHPRLLHLV
jgi:hypothetical protein